MGIRIVLTGPNLFEQNVDKFVMLNTELIRL
jgi:hypothetical protein